MKLRTLTLVGFRSFRSEETIDFTDLSFCAVSGRNGNGKSTLFDAVAFALWATAPSSPNLRDVISTGAKRADVSLVFDLGGETYRVERTVTTAKTSNHKAMLYVADGSEKTGWRPLSQSDNLPGQVNKEILDLLGMDVKTALITWLISQGDFGALCSATPGDARNMLAKAFGLGVYDDLAKAAKLRHDQADRELARLTGTLTALQARMENLDTGTDRRLGAWSDEQLADGQTRAQQGIDATQTELASLDTSAAQTALAEAESALSAYNDQVASERTHWSTLRESFERELAQNSQRLSAALSALHDAQGEADLVGECQTEVDATTRRHDQAKTLLDASTTALPDLQTAHERLQAQWAGVKQQTQTVFDDIATLRVNVAHGSGECFACHQHLDPALALRLLEARTADKERLEARLATLEEEGRAAAQAVQAARQTIRSAETAVHESAQATREAADRLARTQDAAQRIPSLAREEETAEQAVSEVTRRISDMGDQPAADPNVTDRLEAAITAAKARMDAITGGDDHIADLRHRLAAFRQEWQDLVEEVGARKRTEEERTRLHGQIASVEAEHKKAAEEASDFALLRSAFQSSGIPQMVLPGLVDELEDNANTILASLSLDGLEVVIATEGTTQKGEAREEVTIRGHAADGERPYATFSGAEKFRMSLALRIALARCVAARTGSPIETIFLDEGFGTLDEASQEAAVQTLAQLSEQGMNILAVTHIPHVRDSFPAVLDVSRHTGTSRVRLSSGSA